MFIQCKYMYIHCTWVPHIISIYPYGIYHCCLVCTALVIGMYYAIIQELVILCIEVSDRDIPSRNGQARVVAGLGGLSMSKISMHRMINS
jgi:hypothetical protein